MNVENAKDRALYHCERSREKHGVNAPCEILAIGNKIVWEGETDGSGKQLTALGGEGSKKRSPSRTAPAAVTSGIDQQAGLAARPAVPINFERDRPQIIKAIREYYDGSGESYDHPISALGGTMGKIKTLTKLGSAGDQIEVKAEYTWVPNSVIHGMELPHDGKFVLKKEGDTYQVVKMWSKNFGWK